MHDKLIAELKQIEARLPLADEEATPDDYVRASVGFSKALKLLTALTSRAGGDDAVTVDEAWQLVPKEPDIRMLQAGYVAWLKADKTQVYGEAMFCLAYEAALAVAPQRPASPVASERERRLEKAVRAELDKIATEAQRIENNSDDYDRDLNINKEIVETMWACVRRIRQALALPAPAAEEGR